MHLRPRPHLPVWVESDNAGDRVSIEYCAVCGETRVKVT